MNILICGSSGQLAREFVSACKREGKHEVYAPAEYELDITDRDRINAVCAVCKPDVIINCAAYNDVDRAESDPETAHRVNGHAVGLLAEAASGCRASLIHFSTDYVFDGHKEGRYTENDAPSPLGEYGHSKLEGERLAQRYERALVLRTSWVFGQGQQNFFVKLHQWSQNRSVLKVVYDQISVPSYTEDIVRVSLAALEQELTGLFHLVNDGWGSRYEIAREFFKQRGRSTLVLPVPSSAFPAPARRPFFSVLDNQRLKDALSISIPTWQDAVARFCRSGYLEQL